MGSGNFSPHSGIYMNNHRKKAYIAMKDSDRYSTLNIISELTLNCMELKYLTPLDYQFLSPPTIEMVLEQHCTSVDISFLPIKLIV